MSKYDSIIILGATATGKTGVSIELAKVLGGQIINADSTQVYKELNIGTAKATSDEMQNIKHHLIDIKKPNKKFNVGEFRKRAYKVIKKLKKSNVVPIIVGGTGLYIDSLTNNYNYGGAKKDLKLRKRYAKLALEYGNEYVYNILKEMDPETAQKLHPNDLRRVIRAIEVCKLTGNVLSKNLTEHKKDLSFINPLIIGLTMPREVIYDRIEKRVDAMFENGLVDEVKGLYDKGYKSTLQSIKSIGYKELYSYFDGTHDLGFVKDLIKKNTRNYAKRQITWFKRTKNVIWYDLSQSSNFEVVDDIVSKFKN